MMTVQTRQALERLILMQFVTTAIERGYSVRVNDGEGWAIDRTRNKRVVREGIMSTDEDYVHVWHADGKRVGWVQFVYGNDGIDVVSDAGWPADDDGLEMEELMEPMIALIDRKERILFAH